MLKKLKKKIDKVFIGKCEDFIESLLDKYFYVIYCNDVLELLVDPYHVVNILKNKLSKKGKIISSLPNVRFFKTFMRVLLKKDWKYEDYGVMDRTHLRFFTKRSIRDMCEDLCFEILDHKGTNRSKFLKPYLFHVLTLFTQLDMQYLQFATVAQIVNEK